MSPSLRDHDWQISYGPNDDRLNRFYIPALARSVSYVRSAGFFSSSALAVAAAGVAGLIQNRGRMRLLVGAQLSQADVEAIGRGEALEGIVSARLTEALDAPVEDLLRRRLEILAWMVACETLQIRVVLPTDRDGLPVADSIDYYHPKEGVFTDSQGNQVSFAGSVNESLTAWQRNYEQFSVYFSWDETARYLKQTVHRFEGVWNATEKGWIALDIPQAARESLLRYVPAQAPEHDPLAPPPAPIPVTPSADVTALKAQVERERVVFQFLRDAPYLPNSRQLGAATCAITPWPHQVRVAQKIIETFPRRYLLCDEVGLGKTVEAGLVLRQLLLSGYVKRCLLLVPHSVARQWQEELYEKFVLDVPRYEGGRFLDYAGHEVQPAHANDNPFDAFDVQIMSSQLAKRRERQAQVLAARPWDLILVDEAHHARRKDFLQPQYRPNRLLELLASPELRTRSILLMTATPMQVSPVEVWDLLNLLGLGGKWGADDNNFVSFYAQLMQPFDQVDWDFVFDMVEDYLTYGGQLDTAFIQRVRQEQGPVQASNLSRLPQDARPSSRIKMMPAQARPLVSEMARRHTPLHDYMFRSTRDLLRDYVNKGLLHEKVPTRQPQPIWIPMRPEEMDLYHRVEEYISDFYNKYEHQRKGLGFIMTVYRRRLTSSFYALRKSMERRLAFLRGLEATAFDEDDLEQDDLSADMGDEPESDGTLRQLQKTEVDYVQDFLHALGQLAEHDSKTEQLLDDLGELFKHRQTVIIFTQYTDTLDYLRDKLLQVYGAQVACYSGRGGELWNGIAWVPTTKEHIKALFREGEQVKILVCTEAASEGLNLQTCGILINYDMPWNPMRVEQRIGRVDRIGQIHDEVWIRNYFYEDTIEARIYQALARRINWFEGVVGHLQPILAEIGQAIGRLVMVAPADREQRLAAELRAIEEQLDNEGQDILGVYEGTEEAAPWQGLASPVSLSDLESILSGAHHLRGRFTPHPEIPGAYLLDLGQSASPDRYVAVTFDPKVFDEHPNSVHLLSYGSQYLSDLLAFASAPGDDAPVLRLAVDEPVPLTATYVLSADGAPVRIESLAALQAALDRPRDTAWTDAQRVAAQADFEAVVARVVRDLDRHAASLRDGIRARLAEQARQLLIEAAAVDLARQSQADANTPIKLSTEAIWGLARHGHPFGRLLELARDVLKPPFDLPAVQLNGKTNEQLGRHFADLRRQGEELLVRRAALDS